MSQTSKKRKLSFTDLLPIPKQLKRVMSFLTKGKDYDPNQPSLEDLPNEILFLIFSFLTEKDMFAASLSCTKFAQIFHQNLFWKSFVQRGWNTADGSNEFKYNPLGIDVDWKLYSMEKHLLHHPFHGMKSTGKYTWDNIDRDTVCTQTLDELPLLRTTLAYELPNPPVVEMSLPFPRESPSMCLCESASTIVIFGGIMLSAPYQSVSGFHFYNLECGSCVSYDISGLPENLAMERHKMVCIGEDVYIFGGLLSGTKSNTLFKINLSSMVGCVVDVDETKPPARADHNMCVVMNRYIFLFGGSNSQTQPMNDLWIFDSQSNKWWQQPTTGAQPYPRSAHGMTCWRNYVFVYGGGQWNPAECSWKNVSNQLFALNTETFEWTELKPKNLPEIDTFGILCADPDSHFITLSFGGKIYTEKNSSDTWVYDIVENDWQLLTSYHKANDCAGVLFQDTLFFFGGYFPSKSLFETLRLNWKQPYHVYRKLHLDRQNGEVFDIL